MHALNANTGVSTGFYNKCYYHCYLFPSKTLLKKTMIKNKTRQCIKKVDGKYTPLNNIGTHKNLEIIGISSQAPRPNKAVPGSTKEALDIDFYVCIWLCWRSPGKG